MPKYIYELVQCPFCTEQRKSTGLHKHVKTHGPDKWIEYLNSKEKKKSISIESGYKCVECDFIGKTVQSTSSHWWRQHTESGQQHVAVGVGRKRGSKNGAKRKAPAWNKGLTKDDPRVAKFAESFSKTVRKQILDGTYIPKKMGDAARQRLSERQSLHNTGGRSKWFTVAGKRVQGTYEKQFAEKLEVEQIRWDKIKTHNRLFKYEQDSKIKSYAPDFYLPDFDIYVEIKGYWWGNDEAKMLSVKEQHQDKNLVVIFGKNKLDKVCESIKINLPLEPLWSW